VDGNGSLPVAGAAATVPAMNLMGVDDERDTHRTTVDGTVIAYRTTGTGPPVLLLHGWPQTGTAWRKVVPLIADRHTVVVPDLPGFGASSRPADGYRKTEVADRLHALMTRLGHPRYDVAGHDVGGQVCYPLAARRPAAVRSVALVEAGVPGLGDSLAAANPLTGGSWHFGFNMVPDLPELLITGRERDYLRAILLRDSIGLAVPGAIDDGVLDHYADALAAPGGIRGAMGHYRALPDDIADNRELAARGRVTAPVLLVGAREGVGLGWRDTVDEAFEQVSTREIAGCGHYLPEERPAELAALLLAHWSAVAA